MLQVVILSVLYLVKEAMGCISLLLILFTLVPITRGFQKIPFSF